MGGVGEVMQWLQGQALCPFGKEDGNRASLWGL